MRKIVMMISVSLDGYVSRGTGDSDGDLDWQSVDEELHLDFNARLRTMSAFLNGRVMYEQMSEFWPTADRDPSSSPAVVEYAEIWRTMPKIVYSSTLQRADWNATIERAVIPDAIRELQAVPGGDMALGGARLAATFAAHDLIDEYCLYIHPVVLGAGRPLFEPGTAERPLALLETRPFSNGVVLVRYGRPVA